MCKRARVNFSFPHLYLWCFAENMQNNLILSIQLRRRSDMATWFVALGWVSSIMHQARCVNANPVLAPEPALTPSRLHRHRAPDDWRPAPRSSDEYPHLDSSHCSLMISSSSITVKIKNLCLFGSSKRCVDKDNRRWALSHLSINAASVRLGRG